MDLEQLLYKDALFDDQQNGRLVFVMAMVPNTEKLYFFVGVGQGLNDAIDVNNAIAHGMRLPVQAGIAIFFGEWDE